MTWRQRSYPTSGTHEPQRCRFHNTGIDDLVARHEADSTVDALAHEFGIHRTTVMTHLERRGISRRSPRKLTDQVVARAAHRSTSGETLSEIAQRLGVAPSALARELRLTGVLIRARGRPASD